MAEYEREGRVEVALRDVQVGVANTRAEDADDHLVVSAGFWVGTLLELERIEGAKNDGAHDDLRGRDELAWIAGR